MVKKNKRQQNIKTKLIAAICMLLVSSIMMVSSTYAWFTLSTAPEVTGITTSVGANGNLEIGLITDLTSVDYGITTSSSDGTKSWGERNKTWGNLVDVSDAAIYGMDQITLFPSELNKNAADGLEAAMLKIPQYGADGRVSQLAADTVTGVFDKTTQKFVPDPQNGPYKYGVRAVGTASGMTDRQLAYRNARSAANTAMALARNLATQSLNTNGSALANIAIEYGMGADTASFDATDVAALRAIIDDLQGETTDAATGATDNTGALDQIETAYIQNILAYGASAAASAMDDTTFAAFQGTVKSAGSLQAVVTALSDKGITLPAEITDYIAKFNEAVDAVSDANDELAALEAELETDPAATFTWAEIRTAMEPLANPSAMEINGLLASEVKENLGTLVSSVTAQGGLKVIMKTGAGVYADIADQCGDYTASVNIKKVEYNGIVLENMTARMLTETSLGNDPYLNKVATAVTAAGAPAGGAQGTMPITDMYGYIIDMAFRTNAADSSLLLQTTPVDRIYNTNTTGVSDGEISTMGSGSTMTFTATTTDFSNDQVKDLMAAIRIVFFDPANSNQILATAKLDAAHATVTGEGIVASIYLYTSAPVTTTTYEPAATGATHAEVTAADGTKSYVKATYVEDTTADSGYALAGEGVTATHAAVEADGTTSYVAATYVEVVTGGTETVDTLITDSTKAEITALTQGTAKAVSVLVYLDGNYVGNDDVAATAATSMTGKMNLQFASTAQLDPMDYTDLMEQGENADQGAGN